MSKKPNIQHTIYTILRRLRLRTWVSLGLILVLTPLAFATVYGVFGALGGSSADPAAHWSFDEGVDNTCSGGTNDACDASDNGNDGDFKSTASENLYAADNSFLSITGSLTLSAWIRPKSASAGAAEIPADGKEVLSGTPMATQNSLVFVTPKRAIAFPLAVTEKQASEGFRVEMPATQNLEKELDWFIIDPSR